MNLPALLDACRKAIPANPSPHRKWAALYGAYELLLDRGFKCEDAVKFLIERGAIKDGDQKKALKAFHALSWRKGKSKA